MVIESDQASYSISRGHGDEPVDSNSSINSGIMVPCKVNVDADNHTRKSKEEA